MLSTPIHMQQFCNQTIYAHTVDQYSGVEYVIDSVGFRNSTELSHTTAVIGNTLSFGAGIENHLTYASKLNAYNASYCWYKYENHEQLDNIKYLAERCDNLIIQINSLARKRISDTEVINVEDKQWSVKKFVDYFDKVSEITKHNRVVYVRWDKVRDHPIPKTIQDQILINNKLVLDCAHPAFPHIFGPKTHRAIAQVVGHALNVL